MRANAMKEAKAERQAKDRDKYRGKKGGGGKGGKGVLLEAAFRS